MMRRFDESEMAKFVRTETQGLILEIGANDGTDTKWFLKRFRRARVACFECDPRAIDKWRKRIRDPRATLTEAALSDVDGESPFYQSGGFPPGDCWKKYGDWDKSGSLLAFDRHREYATWMEERDAILVKTLRLDTWAAVTGIVRPIDFAWVDVQGAEAMVLRGGQKTIRQVKYWYCECTPRPYYHGQATIDDLHALLPGFRFLGEYAEDNFLWENTEL